MSLVISFDDKFGTPTSEIKLASGEHVFLSLDHNGFVIKLLARPGNPERILFKGSAQTAAQICAGLFDDQGRSKTTPLRILVSAVSQLPDAATIQQAFSAAAAAL